MKLVLLDTNVLSEPGRPKPEPRVIDFISSLANPLISSMSVQEIYFGFERARDPAKQARLAVWIAGLRQQFDGRVVDVDWIIAERAAHLRARAAAQGAPYDAIDSIIAACALDRGAAVATRNVRDFAAFGVDIINPWDGR